MPFLFIIRKREFTAQNCITGLLLDKCGMLLQKFTEKYDNRINHLSRDLALVFSLKSNLDLFDKYALLFITSNRLLIHLGIYFHSIVFK